MIFRFLSSVYFACILIALTLLFVIIGTLIEAKTNSHEIAAHFTYHHPLFLVLLWLYFINILFSTLRRWPFRTKHIPFLLTHAGLLMILGGVLIKNHFGVQGAMGLAEGSSSRSLLLPQSFALELEGWDERYQIPLKAGRVGSLPSPIPHLSLSLLAWKPHLRLQVDEGNKREEISLPFDEHATAPHLPILRGRYGVRFQSRRQSIPFTVRLREARQINYPGSERAYSFESDLLVDGQPTTISMNHVFEKRGYRFYLANLITPTTGAKWIQIVINHDPAKYWLTYPGGIVLALGITLLYFRRLYV